MSATAAVRALAALAEDELAAVRAGDLDAFDALTARRAELAAALPAPLPAEARPALEAAVAAQAAVSETLAALRDDVAAELRSVATGRRTAGGYAAAAGPSAARTGALDLAG